MTNPTDKTVLIVNDSADQRELTETIFTQAGYLTHAAASGREGFRIARNIKLDLIISDVIMPDGNGIELCRWIRADEKLRSLPVLLVSGLRKDADSIIEGLEAGADDYIELPVDPLHLIARAERLIQRKRMEDILKESESQFRSLIENVSDVVSIILPDGEILYQSPSLEQVLGFNPDEVIGKNIFDLIHREDQERVTGFFKEKMQLMITCPPIEYRFRDKSGGWRIFESVGKLIDHPTKGLVAIINTRDITERRQTEQALRESEEKFKAQYNGVPLPTYTWQKTKDDFILTDFNEAAIKTTNGKIAEFKGIGLSEMYADKPEIVESFYLCFYEKKLIQQENLYRYKTTGEVKQLDISYVFVPPNLVMVHTRDITEQTQAEAKLRRSEANLAAAQRITHLGSWEVELTDLRRINNNKVYWSDEVYRIFGYEPGAVQVSINFYFDSIHPDDRKYCRRAFAEAITLQKDVNIEFRIKLPDGGEKILHGLAEVTYHIQTGQPQKFLGTVQDITERKLAQKVLEESRTRLQKQNKVLRELTERHHLFRGSLEDAVREIVETTAQTLDVARVSVWMYEDNKSKIRVFDLYELDSNRHSKGQELSEADYPFYFKALARDFAIAADDARTDSRTREFTESYLDPLGITSMLDVPIRFGGQTVGVICHEHTGHAREWKLDEQNFAGSMADLISLLLESNERRQAEDALLHSQQQYESLLHTIDGIVWEIDAQTYHLNFISKQAERLLGYSLDHWETDPDFWSSLIHEDDRSRVSNLLVEAVEKKTDIEFDYRMLTADGRVIWLRTTASVEIVDGRAKSLRGIAVDITDRKQAEEALVQSEQDYRTVFEQAHDAIIIFAPESEIILDVNERACELYEFTRSEFIGMSFDTISKYPDIGREKIKETLELGESLNFETVQFRKDGTEMFLEINSSTTIYQGQNAIISINRDITERKRAEEAIRFQALLLDTVKQAVIATDLEGTVTYWNQFARELFGWTSSEVIGRNIMDITTPKAEEEAAAEIMTRLQAGKSWTGEFSVKDKNGRIFPAQIMNSPIKDSNGNLIGIVGISFDISDRKQAEQALIEANERAIREYEKLLDRVAHLAEALGSARDLQTIYRDLYSFAVVSVPCNGFFISLYDAQRNVRLPGYAITDGEEFDVSDLPPMEMTDSPNSRAVSTGTIIIEDDFQAAMAGKPIVNIGVDKHPDLPQSCLVAPMSVMGRIVGAVEVQSKMPAAYTKEHATAMRMAANLTANAIENVRLIEQEREREEQLRQAQKIESVGRLTGGIAHDFNNMLTAINGYSDLTLRRLSADDPLRRNVEEIKKAGERSAALTQQLLAFSRQQVLQTKVIDLNEIINDTIQMLERLMGENIQLATILDPKLGRVEADPGQLTQVLMNLVVNARDAMPDGGILTIKTSNSYLDENFAARFPPTQPGSYILLEVIDTGIGMDAETQKNIFEPFFTTKEVGKGTGLGLSTAYGIIKQSDGFIWVKSEIGQGTTFEIYLPRIDLEISAEMENNKLENTPKGAETILIVEDEDIVRALTRQILEESGYRVIEARNGVEALSEVEKTDIKIDLLMTDVMMPQMGGSELAEKLAKIQPDLRILFTSGYTDDAVTRHNVIEADNNFIQKPFTFDTLINKVREILDNKN